MADDPRFAIQDVIHRYARSVDRRDWEGVRSCYHVNANDNHGGYSGGRDGLVDWMEDRHQSILLSLHFVSNILVDFTGDGAARAESYCTTVQQTPARAAAISLRMYGIVGLEKANESDVVETSVRCRFVDDFSLLDREWRIARRTVVFESLDYRVFTPTRFGPTFVIGTRSLDDPLWAQQE